MRRLGSKFSVFSRALAIANCRSLQTQKFAPLSFQIYEFIFCEWYNTDPEYTCPICFESTDTAENRFVFKLRITSVPI